RGLCTRAILLERGHVVADGDTETIVHRYLASVDTPEFGGRRWAEHERLGNEFCRLAKVRVATEAGDANATFLSSQPIVVTMEFDVEELSPALIDGFVLVAADSTIAFIS